MESKFLNLFFCFYVCFFSIFPNKISADLSAIQEAYTSYHAGEHATSLFEREEAFNRALTLYSELEQQHKSDCRCGILEYNLGNTYYQLEEYSMAILHYYRALNEMPGNADVLYNLAKAQEKLGILSSPKAFSLQSFFITQDFLPLSSRFRLFFFIGLAATISLSLSVWFTSYMLRLTSSLTTIAALYFFLGLLYSHYFSPIGAVLIESTNLYRDPHAQAMNMTAFPLPKGLKIEVLDVVNDGQWLKIITIDGKLGFVSQDMIRII